MAISFTVDHYEGSIESKTSTRRTAFMLHTVITLRGVPAELDGWGDMGLFAPRLCLEVETAVAFSGTVAGKILGCDAAAPRLVKNAFTSRRSAIRRGYAGESTVKAGPDLRSLLRGLPATPITSHWERLERAADWLDKTVLADVARLTGTRQHQIDAFLASLAPAEAL